MSHTCPSCGARSRGPFYCVRQVPVWTTQLLRSRDEALAAPRGDVELVLCDRCGLIYNAVYDPRWERCTGECETTQSFSQHNRLHRYRLVMELASRWNVRGKRVLEIGCGNGEFLEDLCGMFHLEGVGIDPAYVPGRTAGDDNDRLTYLPEVYARSHKSLDPDVVISRMTLEHIPRVNEFMALLRDNLCSRRDRVLLFQVPNALAILQEAAFFDIYYDHCNYFTTRTLRYLFRRNGFQVLYSWTMYDGQYIVLMASPAGERHESDPPVPGPSGMSDLRRATREFAAAVEERARQWRDTLRRARANHRKVVLWGGGSKAVAYVSTLGLDKEVTAVVDINPRKQGTYLPGSGHEVIAPEALTTIRPDVVVLMNPIYRDEVAARLEQLRIRALTEW